MGKAPVVVISPGCPSGIGPEVTAAALASRSVDGVHYVYAGPAALLIEGARRAGIARIEHDHDTVTLGHHDVVCLDDEGPIPAPGRPDARALAMQRDGLLRAIREVARGDADALVTAPLRKAALKDVEGGPYPGQTELVHRHLARDERPPLMAFLGARFWLGLLTVHVPLRDVARTITPELVENALARLVEAIGETRVVDETRPARIVVLGVNPHAGEGGLLGDEEERVLCPVIARVRSATVDISDPLPADGFFADVARDGFVLPDAVLAAHHDQGLAPYKLLAKGAGVNVTLGLKAPRTSPDHGTADAIAGTGRASSSSMAAAIAAATRLVAARR